MDRPYIIGVMGPGGGATGSNLQKAEDLGAAIAREGWITLSGGRNAGVMDAVMKGAKNQGGITLGILPDADLNSTSEGVNIPVLTGMGNARNSINVQSSHIVIAVGVGLGTLSEVALAIKEGKHVIFLDYSEHLKQLITDFETRRTHWASSVLEAIKIAKKVLPA